MTCMFGAFCFSSPNAAVANLIEEEALGTDCVHTEYFIKLVMVKLSILILQFV